MNQNYLKYLKYKNKYNALKQNNNLTGGANDDQNQISSDIIDQIHFWGHQSVEHSLFLHLGIEDKALKEQALNLHKKWKEYMDKVFGDIDEHKIVLEINDITKVKVNSIDMNTLLSLINELKTFKEHIIARLEGGEWLGWLWASYVKHILRELNHFNDKINKKYTSVSEEIEFWNKTNSEHAANESHLIEPAPQFKKFVVEADLLSKNPDDLLKEADAQSKDFKNLDIGEKHSLLNLSLKYATELDQYHKNTQTKIQGKKYFSIINPTLIDHVVREGERSIYELNLLQYKK